MIQVKNITKRYKEKIAVSDVSLVIPQSKITSILGPNGSGKTTTFYMICGILRQDSGIIEFDGQDITNLRISDRAKLGIGYLPQDVSVFRKLTTADNINAALEMRIKCNTQIQKECNELLTEFNLDRVKNSLGEMLSGGERRRLEIARLLASKPKYIFLDEPFAGVDPVSISDITAILKKITNMSIGIVITDHNVKETLKITDHGYIMYQGKIIKSGTPEDIQNDSNVKRIYLGNDE